ncbi:MAG TPA: STAS domain-containing protein [Armatimonadota bacterium]|jgi:anti-anti-sigma factor
MGTKKDRPLAPFALTSTEEEQLFRVGLIGEVTSTDAPALRRARMRHEATSLPALIVDDGVTFMDAVAYGALVQWAAATRNRNVGWAFATQADGAGRAFQMAGLNPREYLFATEEAARAVLDRGSSGQRVLKHAPSSLALDGLRHQ